MAKEIQILNNGDALYDIRTKINENFKLVNEKTVGVTKFCVNSGNTTNDLPDLLEYNDNNVSFKVGGQYENLVATNGDNVTFSRDSIEGVGVNGLEDGVYKIFIDDQTAEIGKGEIYSQFTQPENMQDGDIWFNGVNAQKYTENDMSLDYKITNKAYQINRIATNGSIYVACTATGKVLVGSNDLNTWTEYSVGDETGQLMDIAYGHNMFFTIANGGYSYSSTNGTTWNRTTTGFANVVRLKFINGRFIALSNTGRIYVNSTGSTWETIDVTIDATNLRDIVFDGTYYYICTHNRKVIRSTDLTTWTEFASFTEAVLSSIYLVDNKLLVGGSAPYLFTYDFNTSSWTTYNFGTSGTITGFTKIGNYYVLIGSNNNIYRTTDLKNFESVAGQEVINYLGVVNDIAVGSNGTIVQFTNSASLQPFNKVPVGEIIKSGGTITEVVTYPYNVNGLVMASSTNYGVLRTAAETDEMDCSCNDASITPANLYDLANYRRVNTEYNVNDKVGCPYHHNLQLKCIEAGTTSAEALDTKSGLEVGGVIEDGSVKWQVEELGTGGSGDSGTTFVIREGNLNGGKADLIYEPTDPYYYINQTPEAYKDNVVDIATSSNFGDSQNNWWWGQSGGVFGWELGTGFKAYSYHSGPGGTNGQGGQSGQITSVIHTFETPLPAGTYQFKCAGYAGFNNYYLFATVGGVEQQITVPEGMSDKEWSYTELLTFEGEITQIRAQSIGSTGDWGIGPVHLIQRLVNEDFENVLKFKVGGLYPDIKCVDVQGREFTKNSLSNVELSLEPYDVTVVRDFRDVMLENNFTASTGAGACTNQIIYGGDLTLRNYQGYQSVYIQISADIPFRLNNWSWKNRSSQGNNGYAPTGWDVQGSNDGATWTYIASKTTSATIQQGAVSWSWDVNSKTAYKYYKFIGYGQTSGDGGAGMSITFTSFTAEYDYTYTRSDDDGTYGIYVSEENGAYTLPYPLYRQSTMPSKQDGVVWVDTSTEPLEIKQYDGYKWVPFNDVPLGYCVVTAGVITKVHTYDYYTKVDRRDMVECATVIETYSNEGSWYRIWSDGWCEQGVHKDNWGDGGTYNLLVPYRDINYTIVFNGWKNDSTSNLGIQSITPTEINYNNSDTSLKGDLYVCGYLAEERIYD